MGGIMLDSTDPTAVITAIKARRQWRNMAIRAGAGYLDGPNSAWPASAFTELRSLGVAVVEITVTGALAADVADVENSDMTPATAAEWAAAEVKAGRFPCVYMDRSNKPAVLVELGTRGLTIGRDVVLWVATLDGTFTDLDGRDLRGEPGVVAVQSLSAAMLGIQADASVITQEGNTWLRLTPIWEEQALTMANDLAALIKSNL